MRYTPGAAGACLAWTMMAARPAASGPERSARSIAASTSGRLDSSSSSLRSTSGSMFLVNVAIGGQVAVAGAQTPTLAGFRSHLETGRENEQYSCHGGKLTRGFP